MSVCGFRCCVSGKVGPYLLAEQQLSAAAVEALIAELGVVGSDAVANLEVLDFLFVAS